MAAMPTLTPGAVVFLSVVCGALGGVGATLALRHSAPESRPDAPERAPTGVPEGPTPGPTLTAAPESAGRGLEELRARLEAQDARLARLDVLAERLEAVGALAQLQDRVEPKGPSTEPDAGAPRRREQHEELATSIGLKGERAKAFVELVGDLTKRLMEVERQHAKTAEDGDVTTISIAGHAADNERLRGELDTWVGRNLEAAERGKLVESGDYAVLLHRLGSQPRRITIRTTDDQVLLRDEVRGEAGTSGAMSLEVGGPLGLKEILLSDYRHLLR
jgi:hypothetical protein